MICQKCKEDKGTDFRKNRTVCRECDNESAREYRKQLKEREKPASIICQVCEETKMEFRVNRNKCLDCERIHGRKYRQTTDKAKIWAENNKDRMTELQHNWYEKEKSNILAKMNARYQNDNDYRLAKNHRTSLCRVIKNPNTASEYVNCSGDRLKDWLEFQFTEEMTFDNYGRVWTVDHVVPVYTFLLGQYPSDIVLNWFNICPVPKKRNLTKNKHMDTDQCLEHLENIREYTEIRNLETDTSYTGVLESICL